MKDSLLKYIGCPYCLRELACYPSRPSGSAAAADPEIQEGVLACPECRRFFPIIDLLPELLPDGLRDWKRDLARFEAWEGLIPAGDFPGLLEKARAIAGAPLPGGDRGLGYKRAEIGIESKISDPDFFGPGYSSPFNPHNTEFSMHLIRRFGNVLPLLDVKRGDVVLDVGAGYAWTTEWLTKMGIAAIGIDICRTYLEIGVRRMGRALPHLVIGDIEHLPLQSGCLDAVLCFDAFHHIPDRPRTMGQFVRALGPSGRIAMAEPGGSHEFIEVSQDVMDKYGILEKGLDLDDVFSYCRGLDVALPEQHFVLKIGGRERGQNLSRAFVQSHSQVDCKYFTIRKGPDGAASIPGRVLAGKRIKARIKSRLRKLYFDWLS